MPRACRLLAQDVPRLDRLPQFQMNAALLDAAHAREAELEVRREPRFLQGKPGLAHFVKHVLEVLLDEVRQHEAIVQLRAPAHQLRGVGRLPEAGDQAAEQQLLHQTHAGMRRHLESRAAPPDRAGRCWLSGE